MREEVLYVIFLDLTKVYDVLDRSRCLEILEDLLPHGCKMLNQLSLEGGGHRAAT